MQNLQINTDKEGETNLNEPTKLKEYFDCLQLNDVFKKLEHCGIDQINHLLYLNPNELDDLANFNELAFTVIQKMKFKGAVRKMQKEFGTNKNSNNNGYITVSKSEEQCLLFMEDALKQNEQMSTFLENLFCKLDNELVPNSQMKIDNHCDSVIDSINNRRKQLKKSVEIWKIGKMNEITSEMKSLNTKSNLIKNTMHETQQMLKSKHAHNNDDNNAKNAREIQITKMTRILKPKCPSEMVALISELLKGMDVVFDSKNCSLSNINDYGKLIDFDHPLHRIPTLKLQKPIKTSHNSNAYRVRLQAVVNGIDLSHINGIDTKDYSLFYTQCVKSDDDEKKEESAVDIDCEWKSIQFGKITRDKHVVCFDDVGLDFEFGNIYGFKLCLNYRNLKPVILQLQSDVQTVMFNKPIAVKEEKIELSYLAHRGHCADMDAYHPRNLLVSDAKKKYGSSKNEEFESWEDDWVMFRISNDENDDNKHTFVPTKVKIRNSSSTQGVKKMSISLGNATMSEWLCYEPIDLKQNDEYQCLVLNGLDQEIVKNQNFTVVNVEFNDNFGQSRTDFCKYLLLEFQLFGKVY